jgi:hypothetical protein
MDSLYDRPRRHHGFEKPFHWRQIATALVMLALITAMYYQCIVVLRAGGASTQHRIVCAAVLKIFATTWYYIR